MDKAILERELSKLNDSRSALEDRIRFAQARSRYGQDADAAQARDDQSAAALELDRVMTAIRATEAKLRRQAIPPVPAPPG